MPQPITRYRLTLHYIEHTSGGHFTRSICDDYNSWNSAIENAKWYLDKEVLSFEIAKVILEPASQANIPSLLVHRDERQFNG